VTFLNPGFATRFSTPADVGPAIRSFLVAFIVLMLAVLAASPTVCAAKDKAAPGRLLTGKVLDKHDNAVVDAVVYLTNTRTHTVTTYIIGPDGTYRFPELSPNVEYELYAQFKGQKSDAKTVSQFDDRKQINIVLRIDVR
jgi:Carboxypeptidase regulatory-like domain